MDEITEFVRKHPHGTDMKLPEAKPLSSFIPGHFFRALEVNAIVEYAKAKGYSEEDQKKIRQMLAPSIAPVLVSLDDIYGKEEEE